MNNNAPMTNLEYARTQNRNDVWEVAKVAIDFIKREVGEDAPIWERETAYNKWCMSKYNPDEWDRVLSKPKGYLASASTFVPISKGVNVRKKRIS